MIDVLATAYTPFLLVPADDEYGLDEARAWLAATRAAFVGAFPDAVAPSSPVDR